jgi:hypothetical protein
MLEEMHSTKNIRITQFIMEDIEAQINLFWASQEFQELERLSVLEYRAKIQDFLNLFKPENVFQRLLHSHYTDKGLHHELYNLERNYIFATDTHPRQ